MSRIRGTASGFFSNIESFSAFEATAWSMNVDLLVKDDRIICSLDKPYLKKMSSDEVFEAISHPLRIDMLMTLSKKPMGFADLKRALRISSSGLLDFHLRKMTTIVERDADGLYTLNQTGFAALYAVNVVSRKGWQRRSLFINLGTYVLMNVYFWFTVPELFLLVFIPSTAWTLFFVYWSLVKRRVQLRGRNDQEIEYEEKGQDE
ncbi:MAG: ArsR/SmtB family transcription factor [Candidatus Thorarchaeota archaeon]